MWHDQLHDFFYHFFLRFEIFAIFYLFLANTSYLFILVMGLINSRKRFLQSEQNQSTTNSVIDLLKPISIIVPAYNEEETVCESIYSLLRLNYPHFEVIVVNDGSRDGTFEKIKEEFELQSVFFHPPQVLPTKEV